MGRYLAEEPEEAAGITRANQNEPFTLIIDINVDVNVKTHKESRE